jgi:hypothetical protein
MQMHGYWFNKLKNSPQTNINHPFNKNNIHL